MLALVSVLRWMSKAEYHHVLLRAKSPKTPFTRSIEHSTFVSGSVVFSFMLSMSVSAEFPEPDVHGFRDYLVIISNLSWFWVMLGAIQWALHVGNSDFRASWMSLSRLDVREYHSNRLKAKVELQLSRFSVATFLQEWRLWRARRGCRVVMAKWRSKTRGWSLKSSTSPIRQWKDEWMGSCSMEDLSTMSGLALALIR